MCWISIDIEADGLIPFKYSMISFGAVIVEDGLKLQFYATLKPISEEYMPEVLAISGFSRDECLSFDEPKEVMLRFKNWINSNCKTKAYFISDNNGFDWQFINWYFMYFLGDNPFGYNSTNLRSLYQGLKQDKNAHFKHLRITTHSHNALDDAIGNAEALLKIIDEYKLNILDGLK